MSVDLEHIQPKVIGEVWLSIMMNCAPGPRQRPVKSFVIEFLSILYEQTQNSYSTVEEVPSSALKLRPR